MCSRSTAACSARPTSRPPPCPTRTTSPGAVRPTTRPSAPRARSATNGLCPPQIPHPAATPARWAAPRPRKRTRNRNRKRMRKRKKRMRRRKRVRKRWKWMRQRPPACRRRRPVALRPRSGPLGRSPPSPGRHPVVSGALVPPAIVSRCWARKCGTRTARSGRRCDRPGDSEGVPVNRTTQAACGLTHPRVQSPHTPRLSEPIYVKTASTGMDIHLACRDRASPGTTYILETSCK
mmetsp:Transcript_24554/g.73703  ORF Transcript_24554/g.73703 Transcript_24554/m.73703 type:complete len:235 (+) Transcript_24554:671-1375(+)